MTTEPDRSRIDVLRRLLAECDEAQAEYDVAQGDCVKAGGRLVAASVRLEKAYAAVDALTSGRSGDRPTPKERGLWMLPGGQAESPVEPVAETTQMDGADEPARGPIGFPIGPPDEPTPPAWWQGESLDALGITMKALGEAYCADKLMGAKKPPTVKPVTIGGRLYVARASTSQWHWRTARLHPIVGVVSWQAPAADRIPRPADDGQRGYEGRVVMVRRLEYVMLGESHEIRVRWTDPNGPRPPRAHGESVPAMEESVTDEPAPIEMGSTPEPLTLTPDSPPGLLFDPEQYGAPPAESTSAIKGGL